MVVGPGRDGGQSRTDALVRARAVVSFESSAANESVITSISLKKNTGINVVFDTENSPSLAVVTRQFSGTPMANVKGFEGEAKRTPSAHDVAVFVV
jgi:hypothetical protein